MKTIEQITDELKQFDFLKDQNITYSHPAVRLVNRFYQDYPEYAELSASGAWFVIKIGKMPEGIKVHKFENGSIWFVGNFAGSLNTPIASIGQWVCKQSWDEDLEKHSILEKTLYL